MAPWMVLRNLSKAMQSLASDLVINILGGLIIGIAQHGLAFPMQHRHIFYYQSGMD